MNFLIYSERLEYILDLIKKEKLSSPTQLAEKFDWSGKTTQRMIDRLKEKGHPIIYCKRNKKYFLKK
jgi:DeoR/GlpR family transcriptional regulator of sugar metabolism